MLHRTGIYQSRHSSNLEFRVTRRVASAMLAVAVLNLAALSTFGAETVFSGPQPGEAAPGFEAMVAVGERAGERFDPIATAGERPLLLVFVHNVTRPSIGLTRAICEYARQSSDGRVATSIVFLTDDTTQTTAFLNRARHALPVEVPVGIGLDGLAGPGAYGLNRNVTLTVLTIENGTVRDNFALVQPSMAADGPKIGKSIADLYGAERGPTAAELTRFARPKMRAGMNRRPNRNGQFRALLAPVIQKQATEKDVEDAAAAVEGMASRDEAFLKQLQSAAKRIVDSGRLESYGTPAAQAYLQEWSKPGWKPQADSETNNGSPEKKRLAR